MEWRPAADGDVFRAPFPVTAAGVLWRGDSPPLEVRTGNGDWVAVVAEEELQSTTGESASALLTFPPAREVAMRLEPSAISDQPSEAGSVSLPAGLRVVLIDASAGPAPAPGFRVAQPGAPRVLTRSEWGAPASAARWTPKQVPARKVVLHHTATSDGGASPTATLRSIHYYHAVTLEWGDIGYNYLVDRAGNIYEGRAGGPNVVGAHTEDYNEGIDGIALLGSFRDRPPTDATLASVASLIAWRARTQGWDPLASTRVGDRSLPNVFAHRDVIATDCPGDAAYTLLPAIRQRAAALMAAQSPRPTVSVVGTRITPASVSSGGVIRVEATLYNAGSEPLRSQGPDPGTVYGEADSFDGLGHPEQPGRVRVALSVDAPARSPFQYRWGLGSDLAPREARTVFGFVRFEQPGTYALRLGVVYEGVDWLNERAASARLSVYTPGADSYTATVAPAAELYFPLAMRANNEWSTRLALLNTASRGATGTVVFFGADGSAAATVPITLPPRGSTAVELASLPILRAGYVGGAIVRADAPLAAVAFNERAGADRSSVEPFAAGAARLFAPLVARRYHGVSTGAQVQNLGGAPTTVSITYVDEGGATWTDSARVAPMASATFYAPALAGLPDGFVGAAVIESDDGRPMAAQINAVRDDGAAMAYPAQANGAPAVAVPLLYRNRNGWTSGLQVQNLAGAPAGVVSTFTRTNGPGGPWEQRATVGFGIGSTFYLPAHPQLPDDLVASATVRALAGQPIAALASSVSNAKRVASLVSGLAQAGSVLYVPAVANYVDGWRTGVQVQNWAGEPAPVTLTFADAAGATAIEVDDTIPATGARTYYLPAMVGLPEGFSGSLSIAGRPGAQLSAVVNNVR